MNNFVFVKKSVTYRKTLYYLLSAIMIYQTILLCLNFALINKETNYYLMVFNTLFILLFMFITYRHIMPKFKYKVEKAEYKWFKIKDNTLIVKFNDKRIKDYSFNDYDDKKVVEIKYQTVLKETINSVTALCYNVNLKLSDGNVINAILPYKKAKQFVNVVNNEKLTSKFKTEIENDYVNFTHTNTSKFRNIPSYVFFTLSGLAIFYMLLILIFYSTTSGTYYATNVMNTKHSMPVNSYSYMVKDINYSNREDYTISFGNNANKEIKVFYRKSNPNDSYTMYTIDFLMFIALTLFIIGGILLNKVFSPYLAVFGVSLMPFYLLRLLNFTVFDLFKSQISIPFLSLLIVPIYLFISAVLKIITDIIKSKKEKELKYF